MWLQNAIPNVPPPAQRARNQQPAPSARQFTDRRVRTPQRPEERRSGPSPFRLGFGMFVGHQHAMRRDVVIAHDIVAREQIMHGLVKLHADR